MRRSRLSSPCSRSLAARRRRGRPGAHEHSANMTPRQEPAVRGRQRRDAELRHRHRVRDAGRQASTRSRAPTRTACRSSTSRAPRARRSSRPTTAASRRATSRSSARPTSRGARSSATRRTRSATAPPRATARRRRSASTCSRTDGTGKNGTFIADVTDPLHPRTVGFVEVGQGSHNQSIHPSGNYLYNSNSDLITSIQPAIEVFDISNPGAPAKVGELALPPRPGPWHRVARHHVLRRRHARLLGRALAGRDHRHPRPRASR